MITLKHIKSTVEKHVGAKNIGLKSKKDKLPIYRGIYCSLALQFTNASLEKIGREVNIKHDSVIYWHRTVKTALATEPEAKELYYEIRHEVAQARGLLEFQTEGEIDAEATNILENMVG